MSLNQRLHAQSCLTDEVHEQLLRKNPAYKKITELQVANWRQYNRVKTSNVKRPARAGEEFFEIPVVIHVVHTGQEIGTYNNPSDNDLIAMIAKLNAIYAGSYNAGGINTAGSANIPIRFKLAQRTPDCQPTNGINRVDGTVLPEYSEYGVYYNGEKHGPFDLELKALSRWPNTAYMNIWIVTKIHGTVQGGGGIGGYATYPGASPEVDGVVVVNTSIELLAHEVGHFLWVHHTFLGNGDGNTCPPNNDCTVDGDQVCDTEPHYLFGCNSGINPCTNQPWGSVVRNFMNYYNFSCQGIFTAGQSDRMLYALEELRGSLLTSLGGLPTGTPPVAIPPPVAACVPAGITNPNNEFDLGPRKVELANLLVENKGYTQDDYRFYIDHTITATSDCINLQNPPVAYLTIGGTYTISITTGYNPENVRGWIDFNNDGVFQESEIVIGRSGTTNNETHTASFTIPSSGVATCTSLRMRISSDFASSQAPQPCSNLEWGQTEDFIVIIQGSSMSEPSVTIAANTSNLICDGTDVIFTATPVNAGNNPTYLWKKNGVNVGANSNTYSSNELGDGDIINCELTTSVGCPGNSRVASNFITMNVSPSNPFLSISVYPGNSICEGTNAIFTAISFNAGSGPGFQWKKNGINVGTNSSIYTSHEIANGDIISCEMTLLETCPGRQTVTSNNITMTVGGRSDGTVVVPSPVAACLPVGLFGGSSTNGPATVQLADLNVSNGGYIADNFNFYVDHTLAAMPGCIQNQPVAHLNSGETYSITVITAGSAQQNVRGWIDFNNDGIFQSSETIISSTGAIDNQTHTASFVVPPTNVVSCTSLRMRISADDVNYPIPEPCTNLYYGQTEDFIVIIQDPASPGPLVSIEANTANMVCEGTNVTFTATPINGGNNPSYQWKLNGNNVGANNNTYSISTLANGDVVSCVMTSSELNTCTPIVTSNSITMTVVAKVTPTVSISVSQNNICSGTNVTFTATETNGAMPGFQWKLNGNNVGNNRSFYSTSTLANGDVVNCVMTSAYPCVTSSTITSNSIIMNVNAAIAPSVNIAANTENIICEGTGVTFTATAVNGGNNPAYQWKLNGNNVGANNNIYSNNTLANDDVISCVMTSSNLCAATPTATSNSITMSVRPFVTPSVSITVSQNNICAGTSVTFIAYPVEGNEPDIKWKLNGNDVNRNSSSRYVYNTSTLADGDVVSCEMTSGYPCANPKTVTSNSIVMNVNASVMPSITINASQNNICIGTSVTFTATPANGGANPIYQWKIGNSVVGSNSPTYTTTDLTNGAVVTCVLTSNLPCADPTSVSSLPVTMQVNSGGLTGISIAITSGFNPTCTGRSVTFTATATNGGTNPKYQWKVGNTIVGSNSPAYTTTSLTNGAVVTCTLTSNSSCASSGTVTSPGITMALNSPPPVAIAAAGPTTFCAGKNVLLKATTGAGYTYIWKKAGIDLSNQTASTYTADATGSYSVVITNSNGCSATSAGTNVTVNPVPLATVVAGGPLTFCTGKNVLLKAITGTGYTYQWKKGVVNVAGETSSNYIATSSGNYSVSITNASGCTASSSTFNVVVNPLPLATVIPNGPLTFCSGKNVILRASSGTGYTYQWKRGGTNIPGATAFTYTATTTGIYNAVVTNAAGCTATSAAITVIVNPLPVATITPSGPLTFCSGKNVLLRANTGTNYTYQWKKGGINITENGTSVNYTASVSGVYSVVVTNSYGCPVISAPVTVTVNSAPLATLAAGGPTTFCTGKNVLLKAISGTGYTYKWKRSGVVITGQTSSTYLAETTGVYSVEVTNAAGCSTTSIAISVSVVPAPLATVAVAGPTTFCEGKNVLLKAIVGTGYTYQWRKNGVNMHSQNSSTLTAMLTGIYTIVVTNSGGCSTTSTGIDVTVNPAPPAAITANGPLTFPQGGSVILQASAGTGYSYQWKKDGVNLPGSTSESYNAGSGGSYTVVIANSNTCQATSPPVQVSVTSGRLITKGMKIEDDFIRVYPNPLYRDEYLNIEWSQINAEKGLRVTVSDITGRLIETRQLNTYDRRIRIKGASGVYIIEIRWGVKNRKVFMVTKIE